MFSLHFAQPISLCRSRPQVREELAQWDDCLRCAEFDPCYRMSMVRVARQPTRRRRMRNAFLATLSLTSTTSAGRSDLDLGV